MAATDTSRLEAEHQALTEGCGLLDRSERGKLTLTGAGAKEFLAGQVTNDVEALSPGSGCYAVFLTPKGKMLGDLRILAVGEDPERPPAELLLDTERVSLQALFDMIRRFKIGYDVELHKRTVECSLLSLIGPIGREVALRAIDLRGAALSETEHSHLAGEIAGRPIRLVCTEDGVDILCEAPDAETMRVALLDAGAQPVSEAAAEIVRVEHGRPRYGIDLDATVIPQEAGLNERAVSFTKGCYVGQETVARLHYRGKPNRHLRGLRLSAPAAPGAELLADRRSRGSTIGGERAVGRLTSSVLSPRHGPIGLALVRREAEPGATVAVGEQGLSATVEELPFR